MKSTTYIRKIKFLILPLLVASTNIYAAQCNTKQLDQLFNLMSQRGNLMRGVAAYKYMEKSSIYDANQELKLLQTSLDIADANQLNADKLMVFVQIQMDLSKQIENYWIQYWKAHPEDAPDPGITPDISSLRQQIAAIDGKLYPQIGANVNNLKRCSQDTITKQYNKAMNQIKGIPQAPDYNMLIIASLRNISK